LCGNWRQGAQGASKLEHHAAVEITSAALPLHPPITILVPLDPL
jgi:hypothetical protein